MVMKELTIEEKAKAYDEAIERARAKYVMQDQPTHQDLVDIFPELKESEDERIRKELIEQVVYIAPNDDEVDSEGNVLPTYQKRIDKYRTWLEKQGEQKCTAEEVLIKAGLKPYKDGDQWCILLGDNIQEGICGFGDTIDDALYAFLNDLIKSQKEQKPVDKVEPKFKVGDVMRTLEEAKEGITDGLPVVVSIDEEYYHCNNELISIKDQDKYEYPPMNRKQKPAEWSDDNKSYLFDFVKWFEQKAKAYNISLPMRSYDICAFCKEIIERLRICENLVWENINETQRTNAIIMLKEGARRVYTQDSIDKCVDWLKSLRPRSFDFSDEELAQAEKDAFNNALDKIEYTSDEPTFADGWWAAIDFVRKKSLRPQSQWKPSALQIEALESATENCAYNEYQDCLRELIGQLKKLREG